MVYTIITGEEYLKAFKFIIPGIKITFGATIVSFFIAIVLGLLLGIGRISNNTFLSTISRTYIEFIRGVPILILAGYIHYKKVPAYGSEADVVQESQPYNYKSPPGRYIEVQYPLFLAITQMMIKWSKNEKLSEDEIEEVKQLQKKINLLLKGGYVGKPPVTSGLVDKRD